MSEAYVFDSAGEPVDVVAGTSGWRVKRVKARGAPEIVYGADGFPLILPLRWSAEDLRRNAREEGKYRLEPVDDLFQSVDGAQPGYFYLHAEVLAKGEGLRDVQERAYDGGSQNAIVELARLNISLAQTVLCQFPSMMESAATLLRAADGAGLPARPPIAPVANDNEPEDEEEEEEVQSPAPENNLAALVAQYLPLVLAALTGNRATDATPVAAAAASPRAPSAPPAARKSARSSAGFTAAAAPAAAAKPPQEAPEAQPSSPAGTQILAQLSPTAMAHFIALQQALTPEDRALAQGVLAQLRPEEVQTWITELSALSVPAAVEKVRALLHGTPQDSSAYREEKAS